MRAGVGMRMVAAGLLGALVVIAPEVAGSQAAPTTESIHAENVGLYVHYWTPSAVKVEPGGSVQISNPTEVPHGVEWIAPPGGHAPSCDPSIPVGSTAAASGQKWSGSCTFTTAGVYNFYCTVHGAAMRGQITVGTPTTTTTTTTTTTPTSTTPTKTTPTKTTTTPTTSTPTKAGTGTTGVGTTGSGSAPAHEGGGGTVNPNNAPSLSGEVGHPVQLQAARHGALVHGTLKLTGAGAGMHLEAEVTAKRAALGGGSGSSRIGRLERSHLRPGIVSFSIELSAQAKRALRRHGSLRISIRLLLRPAQGAPIAIVRSLTLRA